MRRLLAAVLLAELLVANRQAWGDIPSGMIPSGKVAYTVTLAYVPDPGLSGHAVDVYVRRLTNGRNNDFYKLLFKDVPVLSAGDAVRSERSAILALSPKEVKRLRKFERPGEEIVLRSKEK